MIYLVHYLENNFLKVPFSKYILSANYFLAKEGNTYKLLIESWTYQ